MIAWFDHWLKGSAAAPLTSAPVRLFVMGANEWRDEQEWPLARARPTAYYLSSAGKANTLNGNGVLGTALPPATSPADRYTYDPREPGAHGRERRLLADARGPARRRERATTCSCTRAGR